MSQKLREEKAKERYNYDMNNAKTEFDAESRTFNARLAARRDAFELAVKMSANEKNPKTVEELIDDCEKIHAFITTGVKEPEFKVPENPIKDTHIHTLT